MKYYNQYNSDKRFKDIYFKSLMGFFIFVYWGG